VFLAIAGATIYISTPIEITVGWTRQNLTIDGGGAITIEGLNPSEDLFSITAYSTVLRGLTLQRGKNAISFDSINDGTLTVSHTVIRDNAEHGLFIGYNPGSEVLVEYSTISGNGNRWMNGGGIFVYYNVDRVSIRNSTVSGNVGLQGGGLYANGAPVTIANSTFSLNVAALCGGAVKFKGFPGQYAALSNVTMVDNTAMWGGGIDTSDSDCNIAVPRSPSGNALISLVNTILANNHSSQAGDDCFGPAHSSGNNIFRQIDRCVIATRNTDWVGVDPMLAPLANYGGPTETQPPLLNSVAIDAASRLVCLQYSHYDQRGPTFHRFVNATGTLPMQCDIGAVEFVP
jgi:hypothetical protein